MKFKIGKLPKSQVEILFELSSEEFNDYYNKAFFILSQGLKLDGFRQGKVPKEMAEKEISPNAVLEEALNLAVREKYTETIDNQNIEVISQPEIEIMKLAKDNPLEFKIKVSVLPEVELPDYKSIASKSKKRATKVEEKEIGSALSWLQRSRAKLAPKEESSQKGDFIELFYSSPQIENGREFKDGFVLGQGHFIPGFEEKLEGMMPGTEKEFSLTFPKDFARKELASKKVDFKVKVNSVQTMTLPEINEEWARSLGTFDSLDALRQNIREGLVQEKEMAESQRLRGEILEKIAQSCKMEIPEILVESEKNKMLSNLKEKVSQDLKIPFQDYLNQIKKTEQELVDSFGPEAQKRIIKFLILREIAKRENVQVSEEEVKTEADKILKYYPDIEKAKEQFDSDRLKLYTEGEIKNEKVFQILENLSQERN